MRKTIVITLIVSFFLAYNMSAQNHDLFKIKGNIKGYQDATIILKKRNAGQWITLDSVKVSEGKFQFTGKIDEPEVCYLFNPKGKYLSSLFLENSDITINGKIDDIKNLEIKGSKSQDALNAFNDEMSSFNNKLEDLYKQYKEAQKTDNKELMEQLDSTYYAIDAEKINFTKSYIGSNNKTFAAPYILYRELSYSLEVEELDSLFKLLDPALSNSAYFKILDNKIKILYNVAIGKKAPNFTLNDTLGNPVSLSQFKGKYLLIDFWAAWCRPCRAENPNNVKLYADYKDKGFDILGVSFDNKREAWIKAIKKDGLSWTQVSDLKGWNCAAGKLYGVSAIPHTVLLDKNGVIIAKNLRGEKLRAKISELLD